MVIAQLVPEGPVAPIIRFVVDSFAEGGQNVTNLTTTDAPLS